jgi:hypothetical protein
VARAVLHDGIAGAEGHGISVIHLEKELALQDDSDIERGCPVEAGFARVGELTEGADNETAVGLVCAWRDGEERQSRTPGWREWAFVRGHSAVVGEGRDIVTAPREVG